MKPAGSSDDTSTQNHILSFQSRAVRFTMKITSPPPFPGIPVAEASPLHSFSTPALLLGTAAPRVRSPYSKVFLLMNHFYSGLMVRHSHC